MQAIWQRPDELSSNTLGLAEHACLVRAAANRGDAADTQQQQHEDDVVQPRLGTQLSSPLAVGSAARGERAAGRSCLYVVANRDLPWEHLLRRQLPRWRDFYLSPHCQNRSYRRRASGARGRGTFCVW